METVWFILVAGMLTVYVVLDGFDLGVGVLHLAVARSDAEREHSLETIGPFWDGNEVWLIAAGGTIFMAFPALYAASFSGFYLPLMIVLWLLMLRGISIEVRSHVGGAIWRPFWDAVFSTASGLLALFFGTALGNVVRGVPLDSHGYFFEALWTDFLTGPPSGILDWYTLMVGVAAVVVLALHGALWLSMRAAGEVASRARRAAGRIWWAVVVITPVLTAATFLLQPHIPARFLAQPWGFVFPGLALAGLAGAALWRRRKRDAPAFLASCAYITGMMGSVAFGLYPFVLPANTDPARGLTVVSSAAPAYGQRIGLAWWIPGMILASAYTLFVYRRFSARSVRSSTCESAPSGSSSSARSDRTT